MMHSSHLNMLVKLLTGTKNTNPVHYVGQMWWCVMNHSCFSMQGEHLSSKKYHFHITVRSCVNMASCSVKKKAAHLP